MDPLRTSKRILAKDAEKILYKCLEKGLSFKLTMGNIITLCPPLNISREDLDEALEILESCISKACQAKEEREV